MWTVVPPLLELDILHLVRCASAEIVMRSPRGFLPKKGFTVKWCLPFFVSLATEADCEQLGLFCALLTCGRFENRSYSCPAQHPRVVSEKLVVELAWVISVFKFIGSWRTKPTASHHSVVHDLSRIGWESRLTSLCGCAIMNVLIWVMFAWFLWSFYLFLVPYFGFTEEFDLWCNYFLTNWEIRVLRS